jgi:hypothetical protein
MMANGIDTIGPYYLTMTQTANLSLLEKTQALMDVERSLTATIEKVEPWLTSNTLKTRNDHFGKRVRPIPTTMDQVRQVLAVSRNFASRTSAPAGWNPMAPVVGFSTPNPLPHQLRGGAMAALQLERARQAETDKKRRRQEEEEEAKAANKLAEAQAMDVESSKTQSQPEKANRPRTENQPRPRTSQRPQQKVQVTSMRLSDSESSDEEGSDED